jgi:hypothetical protein
MKNGGASLRHPPETKNGGAFLRRPPETKNGGAFLRRRAVRATARGPGARRLQIT